MLVRAASSHNTTELKYDMLVSSMMITSHNSLCSTRACHLCIDLVLMPLLGNVACNFKKIPTLTQDLSRRCIATSGESVSTYPRRPKAEAFSNAVDVVEHLYYPTDPSTERTDLRVQHTFSTMTSLELLIQLRTRESSVSTAAWRR